MKYIAVFHEWFVSSKGFMTQELAAENDEDAFNEASAIAYRKSGFEHIAFTILQIEHSELLLDEHKKRVLQRLTLQRLSWMERITGKIKI